MGLIKKRKPLGYVSVNTDVEVRISEVIDEISDEVLLDECISRNLKVPYQTKFDVFDFDRERIAFYFGKSRFTQLPELMKLIQEKLESE